jgi:hypothetical protein
MCAGCSSAASHFWIPPNAVIDMAPKADRAGGAQVGVHVVDADRVDLARTLAAELGARGWHRRIVPRPAGAPPLPEDGWDSFEGGGVYDPKSNATETLYWNGEWERDGAVLTYQMTHVALSSPPQARVRVYATYRGKRPR